MPMSICDFCGRDLEWIGTCKRCQIIKTHAMILARQVAHLTRGGGCQLYIGIERTGQKKELLSVKRWSPLEPLESAPIVEQSLSTSQSRLE